MSFLSSIASIIGGIFVALAIALPFLMMYWWLKMRKIKKRVGKYFEEKTPNVNDEILDDVEDREDF